MSTVAAQTVRSAPVVGPAPVFGVIGGSGGVGASTFAAVLALTLCRSFERAVLVDLDVAGGGIDVLLGIEGSGGARWSGLRVDGGYLDPADLLDGLPRAGPCSVLAADVDAIDAGALDQVIDAAGEVGPTVVDLPRGRCPERTAALAHCRVVVVLARADVAGLVAARAVVAALAPAPVGVVLRHGSVESRQAAGLVGVPLLGELPALGQPWASLDVDRLPGGHVALAAGLASGAGAASPSASLPPGCPPSVRPGCPPSVRPGCPPSVRPGCPPSVRPGGPVR